MSVQDSKEDPCDPRNTGRKKKLIRKRKPSVSDEDDDASAEPIAKKPDLDEDHQENEEERLDYEPDNDDDEVDDESGEATSSSSSSTSGGGGSRNDHQFRSSGCNCSLVEKKEREIVELKRKLLERKVYDRSDRDPADQGGSNDYYDEMEDRLNSRMNGMEVKIDQVLKAINAANDKKVVGQDEGQGNDKKATTSKVVAKTDFSTQFLHNKMDKCMRMILELTENMQKINKFINKSQKAEEKSERKEAKKELQKAHTARFATAGIVKAIQQAEQPKAETGAGDTADASATAASKAKVETVERPKGPDPNEQHKWGRNMLLVGDAFWSSLTRLDDVKATVDEMTKAVGFRIGTVRDGCLINDLFDSREILKFPLPNRFKTVAISVGTHDLLTDTNIMTLSDGPISQVKKNNASVLNKKAHLVRKMADKLISMDRRVVLVIPPFGKQRREVFQQWREIVLQHTDDLKIPSFRSLDLYNLMNSTLTQFKDAHEMLESWMMDQSSLKLSDYGTRRLFDALKRCMWAKSQKSLSNLSFLKETEEGPELIVCLRCSKQHRGGPDSCKSKDRQCRRCGLLGHFDTIHEVIDANVRRKVVEYLGQDIYSDSITHQKDIKVVQNGGGGVKSKEEFIGPLTEKEMSQADTASWDPMTLKAKLDDWYH